MIVGQMLLTMMRPLSLGTELLRARAGNIPLPSQDKVHNGCTMNVHFFYAPEFKSTPFTRDSNLSFQTLVKLDLEVNTPLS